MYNKYNKKDTITGVIALISMLAIPVIAVKNRVREITEQEKEKRTMKQIIKYTVELEENLNNKGVIKYLKFMKNIDIPNKVVCKNIIIDVYKLVRNSSNIDDRLKVDLRIILECKGISCGYYV